MERLRQWILLKIWPLRSACVYPLLLLGRDHLLLLPHLHATWEWGGREHRGRHLRQWLPVEATLVRQLGDRSSRRFDPQGRPASCTRTDEGGGLSENAREQMMTPDCVESWKGRSRNAPKDMDIVALTVAEGRKQHKRVEGMANRRLEPSEDAANTFKQA